MHYIKHLLDMLSPTTSSGGEGAMHLTDPLAMPLSWYSSLPDAESHSWLSHCTQAVEATKASKATKAHPLDMPTPTTSRAGEGAMHLTAPSAKPLKWYSILPDAKFHS